MRVYNKITNKALNKIVTDIHNNEYELIKKETVKTDTKRGSILKSPVNPSISKYLYLNNNTFSKCVKALAEDIILGEMTCEDPEVLSFWISNQHDLYLLALDYFVYGYGVGELLFNDEQDLVRIKQAPAGSFTIYKLNGCTYARQDLNGYHNYFHIHGELYPTDDRVDVVGTVLWMGGDELYDMFSVPNWYPSRNALISNILLEELDIDNIQNGNLLSGVLAISGGKQIQQLNEPSFEDKLKDQFSEVGTGLAVSYIENANRDIPLDMEYINLSNSNQDYLSEKYDKNEQSIFECWFMPKERLLNNEGKESMNSNKSSVLWDIYLRSIKNTQTIILFYCNDITSYYFNTDAPLSISLPTFEDNTSIAIDNVKKLIEAGLMSNKEGIEYLNDNLDMQLALPENLFSEIKSPLL